MLKKIKKFSAVALLGAVGFSASASEFKIKPFVEKYCINCHDEDLDKGDRRFDNVNFGAMNYQTGVVYQEILDVLNLGDMPPKKAKKQPGQELVAEAIEWLTQKTSDIREHLNPRSQQTVMRRLNKAEYNHTIRDLFKIDLNDFDPSVAFPDDGEVEGLNTIGSGLVTSDFLLTEMLKSARMVADRVVRPGARPSVKSQTYKSESKEMGMRYFASRLIGRQHIQLGSRKPWVAPVDGIYNIRLEAVMLNRLKKAFPGLLKSYNYDEKSRLAIVAYDTTNTLPYTITLGEFEVSDETPGEIKIAASLRKGARVRFQWMNGPEGSTKKIKRKVIPKYSKDAVFSVTRNPMEMYKGAGPELQILTASVDGPHYKEWPLPGFAKYFGNLKEGSTLEDLNSSLSRLASKAFRSPLKFGHEYAFIKVAAKKYADSNKNLWEAAKAGVATILVSPEFVYQVEEGDNDTTALSSHEIATRLSYFLWSSTPDDRLYSLARQGKLKDASVLKQEVTRMIKDPKSADFVKNFTDHWLELKTIGGIEPNPKHDRIYYQYNLQDAMVQEVRLFILDLMHNNRDITSLVNADYSYMNEGLAKLYGVAGVEGEHMRKVRFPSDVKGRGGLAGMAGLMTVTGNGIESLPVKRGAWVLEKILGVHAPLPPPDVPEIAPDTSGAKTIRDLLELHRQKASCAGCHAKFDHFGLALEKFDQIGRYRSSYKGAKGNIKIDANVESAHGEKFDGPEGLKQFLTQKSDMVIHGLVERMTTYAIGRRLTFLDKKEIADITHELNKQGNGMQSLIQLIVSSDLFLNN